MSDERWWIRNAPLWKRILLNLLDPKAVMAYVLLAAVLFILFNRPDPPNETELCTYYTVEYAGLQACWAAEVCYLSDEEFMTLYKSRKQKAIHCARELAILMLTPTEEPEVEEPNDDLRADNES